MYFLFTPSCFLFLSQNPPSYKMAFFSNPKMTLLSHLNDLTQIMILYIKYINFKLCCNVNYYYCNFKLNSGYI